MSIILDVILAWTALGSTSAMWLEARGWQPSDREARAALVLCGPGIWLLFVVTYIVSLLSSTRSR